MLNQSKQVIRTSYKQKQRQWRRFSDQWSPTLLIIFVQRHIFQTGLVIRAYCFSILMLPVLAYGEGHWFGPITSYSEGQSPSAAVALAQATQSYCQIYQWRQPQDYCACIEVLWCYSGGSPCPHNDWDNETGSCRASQKNLGNQQCVMTLRPINIVTGNKFYQVTDYQSSESFPISVTRFYNSFVGQWSWNYQQNITVTNETPRVATLHRPDGKQYIFTENAGDWQGDPDSTSRLLNDGQDFKYVLSDDTTESYDANGRLINIINRDGLTQTLVYGANQITINSVNESLVLSLDNEGRITTANAGSNQQYRYQYNTAGLLTYISQPDATPSQSGSNPFGEDNPFQAIHYENTTYPDHVTGIIDENGNRASTVQYDAQGRAISSEIANGIEKTTLDYSQMDADDPRVTVTNELGKQTTYHYTTIHGVRKVTQVEGHQSANCAAANQSYTYDANGFKDLVTDWEGNVTDYDHDTRGLEVTRTEAKGSSQQRIITTEWHPNFRLPTKITEPDRVTVFSYDVQGLLLESKETPTP